MSDHTLNDHASAFAQSAERVRSIAEEVAEHVAAGDLDSAILVLGVSHGKMAELHESMGELQKQLAEAGANWKRALGRSGEDS